MPNIEERPEKCVEHVIFIQSHELARLNFSKSEGGFPKEKNSVPVYNTAVFILFLILGTLSSLCGLHYSRIRFRQSKSKTVLNPLGRNMTM